MTAGEKIATAESVQDVAELYWTGEITKDEILQAGYSAIVHYIEEHEAERVALGLEETP